jgi:hypothetical protein
MAHVSNLFDNQAGNQLHLAAVDMPLHDGQKRLDSAFQ